MRNIFHKHIPQQEMAFKPYSQYFHSFYDHKKEEHNFYIHPSFGRICRIIGKDLILEGIEVIDYNNTNNDLTINISKGRLIINDTYVEINDNIIIRYENASLLDDTGFFVLSASFINSNTLRSNKLRYHFTYFDQHNNSHGKFNVDKDKIIIGVYDFSKDSSNNIISFTERNINTITLDSVSYYVRKSNDKDIYSYVDGGAVGFSLEDLPDGKYLQANSENQLFATLSSGGDLVTILNLE